jgi:flavin reductase (DIM6/NTAB) family NADH-FMN oxidoreductase RutF
VAEPHGVKATAPLEAAQRPERDPRDPAWYRQVLGQYPTGVSVITGVEPETGRPTGLVVGSFTSVSLDPPLIAFLPDNSSSSWPKIRPSERFCVNVLAHDQENVCRQFAAKGGDKFEGIGWRPGATGSPIIEGVVAWIDCELDAIHDAGDHTIVIGRVIGLDTEQLTHPLLFFRGGYGRFSPLSLALADSSLRRELHLVDRARPEMETVARDLQAQCTAWVVVGEELVLLASAGEPERRGVPASMVGARLPMTPPIGSTWVAHSSPERIEAWLAHAPTEQREEHRARLEFVRRRGYSVALRGRELSQLEQALEGERLAWADPLLRALPLDPPDFEPRDAERVAVLTIPVIRDGEVELLFGLHGFHRLSGEEELERYLSRLREAVGAVTAGR